MEGVREEGETGREEGRGMRGGRREKEEERVEGRRLRMDKGEETRERVRGRERQRMEERWGREIYMFPLISLSL